MTERYDRYVGQVAKAAARNRPSCSELLEKLRAIQVVIARQVLAELQVNLSLREQAERADGGVQLLVVD